MKFSITERTLLKMLFELGTVSTFSGVCRIGAVEHIWDVRHMPKTSKHEDYYSGMICGIYDKMAIADTLDECLDMMEAIIKEAAA